MVIFELLKTAIIAILSTYLSVTNTLATHIENLLEPSVDTPSELSSLTEDSSPSDDLTLLSRLYAQAGSISRILSENEAFRNAAQVSGAHGSPATVPVSDEDVRARIEGALVNIFCEYTTDRYTRTTTGTGFFITENGVILTNAHVAQFLLLEGLPGANGETECIVRSGNPATPQYQAELLFISPSWVFNNAKLITEEHPQGTGEYDYALLYVTSSLTDTPLPTTYTALPIHTELLSKKFENSSVLTAGYPAEKLLREGPRASLTPKVERTSIEELYTFESNYADIFSVTESSVGEQGASGGPIFHEGTGAIGLIVTKGNTVIEGANSLRALTLSYINRTILEETGFDLINNAGGDLPYRGKVFKDILAPHLTDLLVNELNENPL